MDAMVHSPGVWRVRADNPGPMTLEGTNTWIVSDPSSGQAVVIDPGPSLPSHATALDTAITENELQVQVVLLTHGHADHSEYAHAFAQRHHAELRAREPQWSTGEPLRPGELLAVGDMEMLVQATAGHTSDSVTFLTETAAYTGDTVLGRGTSVVAHPDGRLAEYLDSLQRLHEHVSQRQLAVHPGHGPVHLDGAALVAQYLEHRRQRLDQVAEVLRQRHPDVLRVGDTGVGQWTQTWNDVVEDVVDVVYADVPANVKRAASFSVQAQLEYLLDQAASGYGEQN